MASQRGKRCSPRWTRYASIGVEYVAALGAFCLLGWWIDRHWHIQNHWGLLICALVGLVGGMYNLIRRALAAVKEADTSGEDEPDAPKR